MSSWGTIRQPHRLSVCKCRKPFQQLQVPGMWFSLRQNNNDSTSDCTTALVVVPPSSSLDLNLEGGNVKPRPMTLIRVSGEVSAVTALTTATTTNIIVKNGHVVFPPSLNMNIQWISLLFSQLLLSSNWLQLYDNRMCVQRWRWEMNFGDGEDNDDWHRKDKDIWKSYNLRWYL